MSKTYLQKNVYEAFNERIKFIFEEFDNILVAFSTGKDSGVMLNLIYKYAIENNLTHKISLYYQDYEAIYEECTKYAYRVFNDNFDLIKRKYWFCMPVKASCSVTMHQNGWIPWDEDLKDIWVRNYPDTKYLYDIDNYPYPFIKGTKGFDFRIDFSKHFCNEFGKTAVMVGIRADESLSRLAIFTSDRRVNQYKGKKWINKISDNCYSVYPIYDFTTEDIWVANYKFNFDYNKTYDLYYQSGLPISKMRIASPFHQCGQDNLKLYRVIDPNTWGKMISRVNGVNFTGIYGGTSAMGWRNIKKPKHFTWKQYSEFLISTLPEDTKNDFLLRLEVFLKNWRKNGKGRNPEVIEYMQSLGMNIEVTEEIAKNCHKPKIYKRVILKGDMVDDSTNLDFRHIPNYKDICISILKNDFKGIYLSFGRTKADEERKRNILEKYKNL